MYNDTRFTQKTKNIDAQTGAEKSFGWVRAAVDCDGLAYESARQASRSRARTSGEQHRQVRSANKTVGLKDRRRKKFRMGGRAVDCDGLENRCGGNSTGGSNPSPSARNMTHPVVITRDVLFRPVSGDFCGRYYQCISPVMPKPPKKCDVCLH